VFMGIYQYAIGETELAQEFFRVRSTFSSFSKFAIHLSFLLLLSISLFLTSKDKRVRLVLIITLFVLTSLVYLSYVRGVYIALFISLMVLALSGKSVKRYRVVLPFFLVVVLVFFVVDASLIYRFEQIFRADVLINSVLGRFVVWKADVGYFLARPIIGNGPGFYQHYSLYPLHNDYLRVLIEAGIIGFGLFLALLANIMRKVFKNIKMFKNESMGYIIAACLGCIILITVLFASENILYAFGTMLYFWSFVAIGMAAYKLHPEAFVKPASKRGRDDR